MHVVDDREKFANRERFPAADEVVVDDIPTWLARADIPAHAYVVIVTRGHTQRPRRAARAGAARPALSRPDRQPRQGGADLRRAASRTACRPTALKRVHAPIGLDIGAVTPQEIAVSILAELIAVKHGKEQPAPSHALDSRQVVSPRP